MLSPAQSMASITKNIVRTFWTTAQPFSGKTKPGSPVGALFVGAISSTTNGNQWESLGWNQVIGKLLVT